MPGYSRWDSRISGNWTSWEALAGLTFPLDHYRAVVDDEIAGHFFQIKIDAVHRINSSTLFANKDSVPDRRMVWGPGLLQAVQQMIIRGGNAKQNLFPYEGAQGPVDRNPVDNATQRF